MHTPGPWTVEMPTHGAGYMFIRSSRELGQIATVHANAAANAKLIAAAPDLLDALLACTSLLTTGEHPALEAKIKAALAKAR